MSGYLYVLGNAAMPGIVKIGKTSRTPQDRARELSVSTGVPLPFVVLMSARFDDESAAERQFHRALASHRLSSTREFFQAELLGVYGEITNMTGEIEFTPEGEAQLEREMDEVDRGFMEWMAKCRDTDPAVATFAAVWEGK